MDDAPETTAAAAEWRWGLPLVALALLLRVAWVLAVPTVPVGDFATYRESANYLVEFGSLDHGFIYMPGFVLLLAGVRMLGGELVAQKLLGAGLGGLGAAAIFGLTARLIDGDGRRRRPPQLAPRAIWCACPAAVVATSLYAIWPAGVAMSSVVGTDVPAACLILCALWALCGRGDRRPWRAALAFGVVMGLAAYIRAVALPLTLMSGGYWLARLGRRRWRQAALLTALAGAATLVVLLPWALRNKRAHGELFFTDSHGGITALIGANPNSEGTYSRALNTMFRDLTGRTVLDEPHRETDRMAYALAKDWTRYELPYAAGLVALKADRLLAPERDLLYWPIGRPGVLVGPARAWFGARAAALNGLTDGFWFALVGLFTGGGGLALYQRRWLALVLLPFQAALAATYIGFFAEPRYRIPIEMMAFPLVAFMLLQLWAALRHPRPAVLRPLAVAAAGTAVCLLLWAGLLAAGARLRTNHHWAATVWTIDGQARQAKWRRADPADGPSPISGAPNGVRLSFIDPGQPEIEAAIEAAALPAGIYDLRARIDPSNIPPGTELELSLRNAAAAADEAFAAARLGLPRGAPGTTSISGALQHPGGPLRLLAHLTRQGPAGAITSPETTTSLWVSSVDLKRR